MRGPGREGTASAPVCLENLALLGASASSSSGSGRTISQPTQKDTRIYSSGHREGVNAAMGRLLHNFGVGKGGTAEREVLSAKAKVATSAPLHFSFTPSPPCRSQSEVTMGTKGISCLGSNKQVGGQQVQKAGLHIKKPTT